MRSSILTQKRAKALRRTMTEPERLLWALLRRKQQDLRFRRQHAMGPFILDFYCPASRLCVEVDGLSHVGQEERDSARTAWLEAQGIRVVRVTDRDVLERPAWVVGKIVQAAALSTGFAGPPPP